jgi:hypothetical protein
MGLDVLDVCPASGRLMGGGVSGGVRKGAMTGAVERQ